MSSKIKEIYKFKNPWLRFIAHKLNVIDKGLCVKYYNEQGTNTSSALQRNGYPTNEQVQQAGIEAIEDITRMLNKIKHVHYGISEELQALYNSVEQEFDEHEKRKYRPKMYKWARTDKKKYNWRKHLKKGNKSFRNESC